MPWALMMPGTTNLPVTSITLAPAGGAVTPVPMSRSRPFSITMVTLFWGAAPLPSISVAPQHRDLRSGTADEQDGRRQSNQGCCAQVRNLFMSRNLTPGAP
jgi:hypothetical protein